MTSGDRSLFPAGLAHAMDHRHLRTLQGADITASGRTNLVGAGSLRGTEVNINTMENRRPQKRCKLSQRKMAPVDGGSKGHGDPVRKHCLKEEG